MWSGLCKWERQLQCLPAPANSSTPTPECACGNALTHPCCTRVAQDAQRQLEEAAEQRDRERERREQELVRSARLEAEMDKEKRQRSEALARISELEDRLANEERLRGEASMAASQKAAEEAAALRSALAAAEERVEDCRRQSASERSRLADGSPISQTGCCQQACSLQDTCFAACRCSQCQEPAAGDSWLPADSHAHVLGLFPHETLLQNTWMQHAGCWRSRRRTRAEGLRA